MIEITASLKALSVYNNAIVDMKYAITQERRNRLQHKANIALAIYLRAANMPYLADRLPR